MEADEANLNLLDCLRRLPCDELNALSQEWKPKKANPIEQAIELVRQKSRLGARQAKPSPNNDKEIRLARWATVYSAAAAPTALLQLPEAMYLEIHETVSGPFSHLVRSAVL